MTTPALRGRAQECCALDQILERVRGRTSAALVIRGEAGIGKTSLMSYCVRRAVGCRVAQISGVESELELPFAALHQLCGPMLIHLAALPEPQERALQVAFGLAAGSAPDTFVVGLAVLSLLAEVALKRPLVCVVDDAQWLDDASRQVLGFVARRLLAESVVLLFAVRETADGQLFPGLPSLTLGGLPVEDARAVLAYSIPGHMDETIRDRIVAETHGNPLGLLELSKGMSRVELAGGFAPTATATVSGQIYDHYLRRVRSLPQPTQRLMLLAATDPTGDTPRLWRAAHLLGIEREAAAVAEGEHLLEIGSQVRFRHPLVRSAASRAFSEADRRAAHSALAAATDPESEPDRRAWHRAQATSGPDEDVAAELERSAGRAQARGGLAAAAAFLERSANLTADPARRLERTLAAAQCQVQAGDFEVARRLLAAAESEALDEFTRARVELLRGRVASASDAGSEAPAQLLKAARRLERLDVALARETYLDAWGAALFAGRLAIGSGLREVSHAARTAPRPTDPLGPSEMLLDGLALLITEGHMTAAPVLGPAVSAFRHDEVPAQHRLQWGVLASAAAVALWDFESWDAVTTRQLEYARGTGALALLSIALNGPVLIAAWRGDFEVAAAVGSELEAVQEATGTRIAPYGPALFVALQGRVAAATSMIEATIRDSTSRGEGLGVQLAHWTSAILNNGLGRYKQALDAATHASDDEAPMFIGAWALLEVIEAAARTGNSRLGARALERLEGATTAAGTDWALGVEARARALLSEDESAERYYREAIDRLTRTPLRPESARAHLLYGEWLRRHNRRIDARQHLRISYEMFDGIGMEAFSERARRELLATGEKARKRDFDTRNDLTPQEDHIARLAREGRTNSEIGAELFISARTVEWHLGKVFTKLGVTSRRGLRAALPARSRTSTSDD